MASPVLPNAVITDEEWKDRKVALITGAYPSRVGRKAPLPTCDPVNGA